MRIGLLGSGAMGQRHLAAYAALSPDVNVVTRASASYVSIPGADREALFSAMLSDPSLDAIDICLPTSLHPRIAIAALAAGKHVLCEKPMALTQEDCSQMLAAARQSDRVFMVAHVLRFFPAYRLLAEVIRSRRYGQLRRISFTRSSGIPTWAGWLTDSRESGAAVLDLMVHDFDQAIALFGAPAQLTAEPIESDDTVRAILGYRPEGDAPDFEVEICGGWFRDGRSFSMGFDAEFDSAVLVFAAETLTVCPVDGRATPRQAPAERVPLPATDPYTEQLRYFVACCRSKSEPAECLPEASAQAVSLALAVRDLARRSSSAHTEAIR